MKKQIRIGVFESNSSSSHSLAIADTSEEFLLDTIVPNEDGNVVLNGGEFGWAWQKFNDALTKANYCAVDSKNDENRIHMLTEVLKEQTECKDVVLDFSDDYDHNWSYVDHQSVGTSGQAFDSKETLRNFIFNKNSWLFTGNDNSEAPNGFYDAPDTKYAYALKIKLNEIDNIEWKFKSYPSEEELHDAVANALQDARYNKTRNKWQIDESYWSGGEVYFECRPWSMGEKNAIDIENKKIIFFNVSLWNEASKMCPKEWQSGDMWSKKGCDWTREKEKELGKLPENRIEVSFEIVEL